MTVGELSQRTGVPVKTLRECTDLGLIYTLGRSQAGYRLFDAEALWCVRWIGELRGLGLGGSDGDGHGKPLVIELASTSVLAAPAASSRMAVLVKGREAGMATETRGRMLEAAVQALQRRGVAGMSFTEVLRDSGAARGAIYHHFPGGKAQLVAEAATRNGQDIRAHLGALPAGSPHAVVEAFLTFVRPVIEAATTGSGCAVAAVTVDPDPDPESDTLREVAATAFGSWIEQLSERLAAAGVAPREADDLAAMLVTLLEGAHVLCRASGTLEPFEQTARTALALTQSRYPSA
ncbi:TetR family transcriptional regulator [Streptomyces sp. ISL-94]|uniref:LmrA/YxaF family transcription factor n=1 Tax=Streptomyces sp. ISL-94 TaxID=2819190 RepID=UPI001BEA46D2|nr:TetR family transcriptional regulator [Streptomyces sp. ISL-94]MBT2478495.1 TetR family transcriptional regulator [Streptomyces sp. ISL-94]